MPVFDSHRRAMVVPLLPLPPKQPPVVSAFVHRKLHHLPLLPKQVPLPVAQPYRTWPVVARRVGAGNPLPVAQLQPHQKRAQRVRPCPVAVLRRLHQRRPVEPVVRRHKPHVPVNPHVPHPLVRRKRQHFPLRPKQRPSKLWLMVVLRTGYAYPLFPGHNIAFRRRLSPAKKSAGGQRGTGSVE